MNLNNTYNILMQRSFLVKGLPEPMLPSESHLQVFDNYIENSRIRLRKMRVPETKSWTRVLEQIYPFEDGKFSKLKISQMFLTDIEYKTFEVFKGKEIRKNRYFYKLIDHTFEIDIYLGALWGLNTAKVYFKSEDEMNVFEAPSFAITEITDREFFFGCNLVERDFADVQAEVAGCFI